MASRDGEKAVADVSCELDMLMVRFPLRDVMCISNVNCFGELVGNGASAGRGI